MGKLVIGQRLRDNDEHVVNIDMTCYRGQSDQTVRRGDTRGGQQRPCHQVRRGAIAIYELLMNDPRDNVVDSSFYAGIFVEAGAKPNIVSNIFHGGDSGTLKSSVTQVNSVMLYTIVG